MFPDPRQLYEVSFLIFLGKNKKNIFTESANIMVNVKEIITTAENDIFIFLENMRFTFQGRRFIWHAKSYFL